MLVIENVTISLPLIIQTFREITSSGMFWLLIVLMLVDIILGKYYAILTGEYSSSIGTKGLIKHSTILLLTLLVSFIFRITNQVSIVYVFKGFYILEYLTSIVENLTLLEVNLPKPLVKYLNVTKETYDDKVERSLRKKDDI